MLVPISWLKEFVEIKLPLKTLMWKMTESGLTCETYEKVGDETVLDVEVTANRPDWMSILGVAREVAAIQGVRIKGPKEKSLPEQTARFPLDLETDYSLFERWTGVVLKGIEIKPSPDWLQERIRQMGHSPINNVIDITNYVMYEMGIPMHAFDYDEVSGQVMTVQKSKGGEDFTSVDGLAYTLPKDAIIIRDAERLIDLAGIKGGLNSGIKNSTKNVFLHITIDSPVLVRRTSIALGLRSDASAIYERGPDKGNCINVLKRAAGLILELAGGEVASEIMDIKKHEFGSWNLELGLEKLEKILGIKVPTSEVVQILSRLNLSPKLQKEKIICKIPTYRADLKIEEDLTEEVARIYGYNKFPLTLPSGKTNPVKIPHHFDDRFILNLKNIMASSGYSECLTLSLISKVTADKFDIASEKLIKITNPVSLEYEYMRNSLIPGLFSSTAVNAQNDLQLFEIDKVYLGNSLKPDEVYKLGAISKGLTFRQFKGVIDLLLQGLNIQNYKIEFETDKPYFHPSKAGTLKIGAQEVGEFGELHPKVLSEFGIKDALYFLEFDVQILKDHSKTRDFESFPENPAQVEDLTLTFPPKTRIGEVVKAIKNLELRINNVELINSYNDNHTFRVWYQDAKKTLTNEETEKIRKEILKSIIKKFGGTSKE